MKAFEPNLVYMEPRAMEYPLAQELYERFQKQGIEIRETTSHNQVRGIPGNTEMRQYANAKNTLVIGVRKTLKFDTSKPSAEYAIPLATGCMGHCHYCYLQTTLGKKPYIRTYVNLDEIFDQATQYINERAPEPTRFEAACTSDIVGIDHITHSLKKTIEFMGAQKHGRLRFVTKYHHVDHLLDAQHNGHTRFRFSINADYVIKHFEPGTSPLKKRLEAARKVADAGYPLGFIVAPIYIYDDNWKEGYYNLFANLYEEMKGSSVNEEDLTFELIQHRFTKPAKKVILQRYPKSKLEMDEEERKYRGGKYGIGKYVYPKETQEDMKATMEAYIGEFFPNSKISYFT
ncbi:spore photoproduct lyase [Pontibacillus marinus]|uniref:Spore photoproduct lyase n=1 Tax=Pontibacillus marinus BH030004 = DSM 16465 TaxID=1385511 RepID=A0A0A5HJ34_9BACI|nr:spore photoproduct lyase [Pontibacillus marinus]KGX83652.1 radical SAM protein [Pontibacillus marinus BH030004 = DSM 16465]